MNDWLDMVDCVATILLTGAVIYGVSMALEEFKINSRNGRHD